MTQQDISVVNTFKHLDEAQNHAKLCIKTEIVPSGSCGQKKNNINLRIEEWGVCAGKFNCHSAGNSILQGVVNTSKHLC